ncbi:MAG: hypothetical protein AABN34_21660 [Acidobacteriota bacterium]
MIVDSQLVGLNAKKFRMVVSGTDFDAGAQLLVNNISLSLERSSTTERVGQLVNALVQAPGELSVQVRNSTGEDFEYTQANGKSLVSVPSTNCKLQA